MAAAYESQHLRLPRGNEANSTPPQQFPARVSVSGTPSFAGAPDSTANRRFSGHWRPPFGSGPDKPHLRDSQLLQGRLSTMESAAATRTTGCKGGINSSSSRRLGKNSTKHTSGVTPFSPRFREDLTSPPSSSSRHFNGSRAK